MKHVFTAKSTELFNLNTFWFFLFVFGAVISNTVALGALKMNCLAHILIPTFFALPRLQRACPLSTESHEDFWILIQALERD